ncbi:MAG TPA: hypothetical protein VHM02_03685, partial [Thermoanaerobaculia bacterium]|nr:hypothetical protein [Thermoanaerobaculia bacterium]
MSRSSRLLSFPSLSIILAFAIGPCALAQPPSLDRAVQRVGAALAAGAAPGEVDEALAWLLAAAEGEPGRAP